MALPALPDGHAQQRAAIRHVLVHVASRARRQVDGHVGLVPTPGGLGTPAFGPDGTVVRLTPTALVVEGAGPTRTAALAGATVRSLAQLAGADLDRALDVGGDTPALGDPDAPLALHPAAIEQLAAWHALAWQALDRVVAAQGPAAAAARLQLWPEHLDSATDVAVGHDEAGAPRRVGLGASSGDELFAEPYLYVGPWGPERPGDPAFWNAPFGAVRTYQELRAEPLDAATAFLATGLALLR